MLNHRGFTAWIQVDGKPLPEYLVTVENEGRISCWIPGISEQVFTVYWQDSGTKVHTCAFIVVDGTTVSGRFLWGDGVACRGGVRTSVDTERPFMFLNVPNSAPEESSTGKSSFEPGTIILKIKRVKCTDNTPANPINPVPTVLGKRKAGELCVGLGYEVKAPEQLPETYKVVSYEDPEATKPSTYVSFVFRYRSPEFLEAQGIAPRQEISVSSLGKGKQRAVSQRVSSRRRVASAATPKHPAAEDEQCSPSAGPSAGPSRLPYAGPSAGSSRAPSVGPSAGPSRVPSACSSAGPSRAPSVGPSAGLYSVPSAGPSAGPSRQDYSNKRAKMEHSAYAFPAYATQMPNPSPGPTSTTSFNMATQPQPKGSAQHTFFLPPPTPSHDMPSSLPTLDSLAGALNSTANTPTSIDYAATEQFEQPDQFEQFDDSFSSYLRSF